MKKIVHLSHNDLDGYGAQLVAKKTGRVVAQYNTNYGAEILEKVEIAIAAMNGAYVNHMLLITDVNLTLEIADAIDAKQKEFGFELLLLDHHITGKDVAIKYDWYNLDASKCATRIAYEYFQNEITDENIDMFSQIVNAYDLWQENHELFHKGKLLNEQVFEGYKFPKEVHSLKVDYVLHMLEKVNAQLKNYSVAQTEDCLNKFKRMFLSNRIEYDIISNNNKTMNDKFHYLVFKNFKEMDLPIVSIDGIRFKVFFNIDGGVYQNMSSLFNDNANEFDACINISKSGIVGLRSKGSGEEHNVSRIAKKFFNGGGHFNASGGSIELKTKEIKSINEAIELIQGL